MIIMLVMLVMLIMLIMLIISVHSKATTEALVRSVQDTTVVGVRQQSEECWWDGEPTITLPVKS
jgi:hypothetical protein